MSGKKSGESNSIAYSVVSEQGLRKYMEDEYSCDLLVATFPTDNVKLSYFAVYDGHGGAYASKFLKTNLFRNVVYQKKLGESISFTNNYITNGFHETDETLFKENKKYDEENYGDNDYINRDSGSTCVSTFIMEDKIWFTLICCNVGDSRCVLYDSDGIPTPLSNDHKPNNFKEIYRIKDAGYFVENGRVNGNLAVSRAFGDFEYKMDPKTSKLISDPSDRAVSCTPDIKRVQFKKKDKKYKFMVLASDGIWDVFTNDEVGEFVEIGLDHEEFLEKIADSLVKVAITKYGSSDNCTVIIVLFK